MRARGLEQARAQARVLALGPAGALEREPGLELALALGRVRGQALEPEPGLARGPEQARCCLGHLLPHRYRQRRHWLRRRGPDHRRRGQFPLHRLHLTP